MIIRFRVALLLASLAFLCLFGLRFAYFVWDDRGAGISTVGSYPGETFENPRKNYASAKLSAQGQPLGDTQKFEKVGTLAQSTRAFEADRKRIQDLIVADGALVQLERSQGLTGSRRLDLGIGVPPERFDGFVEQARGIGKLVRFAVVKNDKTNEYLQLRAKRTTLDKTRAALEKLQQPDNKVEGRLNVLNRLTEVEQQIQELGVSLGDFDAANELTTVKFSLSEVADKSHPRSLRRYVSFAVNAIAWVVPYYLAGSIGLLALAVALWLASIGLRMIYNQVSGANLG